MSAPSTSTQQSAWKTFESVNSVSTVDDNLFKFDAEKHKALCKAKPWRGDVKYFKKVKMSAVALLKMVVHARSGGELEVMGMMQGHVEGDTMIVTDSFALPVEGSETRVNAQAEAFEYMIAYLEALKLVGRTENCIGWYHSHPGYKCWLSGIDVNTQKQNQMVQDPWLAVVVDPVQTMASGKVEVGAFRTYPEGYTPPDAEKEYQSIPKAKMEEFGKNANEYYKLPVELYKSSVDTQLINLLWSKYWINNLTTNPLVSNREYLTDTVVDFVEKLDGCESGLMHSGRLGLGYGGPKKEESLLSLLSADCAKMATETLQGVMNQVVKDVLFNPTRNALKPKAH